LRRGQSTRAKLAATAVAVAVVIQVAIGMNLIWKGWPLWLGTAHNAGAALLVLSTVALLRSLSPRSEVGRFRPSFR
jgi:heme A synthase